MDEATIDDTTLQAARSGSRAARSKLLCALQDPWYRLCLGLLSDADLARDATQETALRFLRQLPGFRGESQVRTWSLGIALNVVREFRRKRRRDGIGGDDGMEAIESAQRSAYPFAPDADAERAEECERLRTVLAALPERQREAIVLRFFEDMSVEDTASVMGCASGTVKATVHQALRSLRERLTQPTT